MVFDISATHKNEPSSRLNVYNTEFLFGGNGITIDLLSTNGHTGMLLRSDETTPIVWGNWETDYADYIWYYTVTGRRDRMGDDVVGERLRLMPCKSFRNFVSSS